MRKHLRIKTEGREKDLEQRKIQETIRKYREQAWMPATHEDESRYFSEKLVTLVERHHIENEKAVRQLFLFLWWTPIAVLIAVSLALVFR